MTNLMDYSQALTQMRAGEKVQREGWNGKGMWVCLSNTDGPRQVAADKFWSRHTREYAERNGGFAIVLPCFLMKNARDEIVQGWLASQEDMLATDWQVVA